MSNLPTWAGAEMIRMEDEKAESRNYACVACDGYPASYNSPCVVCGRVMETAVDAKDAEIARLGVRAAQAESDLMLMRRDRDAYHASMMKAEAENERLRDDIRLILSARSRGFGLDYIEGLAQKVLRGESDAEIARLRAENERLREMVKLHCDPFYMTPEDQALWEALRGESD